MHEDGKAVLAGAGGVGAWATVGGCPATGAQRRPGAAREGTGREDPKPSQGKRPPCLPQVSATLLRIRQRLGHQAPEVRRVILMGQVRQLVDDDVFDEGLLQHHGAPVEAQRAVGCAAPPALALVADEYLRLLSVTEPGPPAVNNVRQPLGSPVPIPSDDRTANRLVAFAAAQGLRYCDSEAPVVEVNLRRPHVRGIDDHADVASQVRQGFAADEALRRGFQHLPRRMAEDPGRPLANDGP